MAEEQNWAKEPWEREGYWPDGEWSLKSAKDYILCQAQGDPLDYGPDFNEATLNRIIVCVNACQGIRSEILNLQVAIPSFLSCGVVSEKVRQKVRGGNPTKLYLPGPLYDHVIPYIESEARYHAPTNDDKARVFGLEVIKNTYESPLLWWIE